VLQPLFASRSRFADPLLFPDQNCTGGAAGLRHRRYLLAEIRNALVED